jgi:hypothetical protein
MAVRLMQFGAGRLVVTGSVVMRQSSRGRCSDESGAIRRRQRDGATRRRQACRTAVERARRPRVVVPGYLFRLAIDTAGDPTITTTGYQTRAGDGRSVAHGGFPCHAHVGRAVIGRCIKFSSGVLRLCDR